MTPCARRDADRYVGHLVHFSRIIVPLRPYVARALAWRQAAFSAARSVSPPAEVAADAAMLSAILGSWGCS